MKKDEYDFRCSDVTSHLKTIGSHFRDMKMCGEKRTVCLRKARDAEEYTEITGYIVCVVADEMKAFHMYLYSQA